MRVEKSSHIRPFAKDDIPPVASLFQRVFFPAYNGARGALLASLERYFEELFFAEPWQDESISSLVCIDAQGRLMADPNSQALAGVQLLKALFSGPQDLTFTDHGGDLGRWVWEGMGGYRVVVKPQLGTGVTSG